MKFDVIINTKGHCNLKKIMYVTDQSCIEGNKEGVQADKEISVLTRAGEQAQKYPSINNDKVLYAVNVGDYITIQEMRHGIRYVNFHKVNNITDTEVICGPCD